jgi:outer membrane protein assembly factor BamB
MRTLELFAGTPTFTSVVRRLSLVLMLLLSTHTQPQSDAPWGQYGRTAAHTGLSPFTGPSVPLLKWMYMTSGNVQTSPAIGADGTIYVGSHDSNLYALDGSTGALKWVYATDGVVQTSPAIGADGTIYVGSDDYNLYALDGSTGILKWKYATGDTVQSSPAIGADGTIYVGS